jgi:hypothetical protein
LTGANCNDVTQLLPLVDAIAPIRGVRGRPLQKPEAIYADRGYDSERHRQELRERGITPCSPSAALHTAVVWESTAGSSSVHMPGCVISAVFVSASNVVATFTKHSSNSAAA